MPGGVDEVVVIVNTVDLAFESVMDIELGLNETPVLADCPVTLRATLPVNPPAGVMFTV